MITRELANEKSGRGRPRSFDRAKALAAALRLFWQRGYEGTSIAELTGALGINPPALYAAFGSKEALYREVLDLYRAEPGSFTPTALVEEPTAYAVIARVLREAAAAFASANDPAGCMISIGMLACSPEHDLIARKVAELRIDARDAIAVRIARGQISGELPANASPTALAAFYASVLQGMSVQAHDGASRELLLQIAETALKAWPVA